MPEKIQTGQTGQTGQTTSIQFASEADFNGLCVLVRADFNVPMRDDGSVRDDVRMRRAIPSLKSLLDKGARLVLISHFGRPKGHPVAAMSLAPVAGHLEALLGERVCFLPDLLADDITQTIRESADARVFLLENLRFYPGEEANDAAFAAVLARLADAYVNDAFSCSHRAHASIEAITRLLPAYAGETLGAELHALSSALEAPMRPLAAVVGGAKISTKLAVLKHLISRVDKLILGGAMANTFLAAQGVDMAASLVERDMIPIAVEIMAAAKAGGCEIILPVDGLAARKFAAHADYRVVEFGDTGNDNGALQAGEMILDIGPASVAASMDALSSCKTLVWNGPMGAFEIQPFDGATTALAQRAAELTTAGKLISVAGGGDTLAAMKAADDAGAQMTYLSLAGGAFLEWLEGKQLPGIVALERASRDYTLGDIDVQQSIQN